MTDQDQCLKWDHHSMDFAMAVPTILGNRQSEAIEGLLAKLGTDIDTLRSFGLHERLPEPQLQKQRLKICLLESGRHLLIAIQFLHVFWLQRRRLKETNCTRSRCCSGQKTAETLSW